MLLCTSLAFAQSVKVTGTVTDKMGAVIGATIMVKNSSNGTVTDIDGRYSMFDLIEETRNNGKHLFVLGNGGSAAAASHWVCDFGKGINRGDTKPKQDTNINHIFRFGK